MSGLHWVYGKRRAPMCQSQDPSTPSRCIQRPCALHHALLCAAQSGTYRTGVGWGWLWLWLVVWGGGWAGGKGARRKASLHLQSVLWLRSSMQWQSSHAHGNLTLGLWASSHMLHMFLAFEKDCFVPAICPTAGASPTKLNIQPRAGKREPFTSNITPASNLRRHAPRECDWGDSSTLPDTTTAGVKSFRSEESTRQAKLMLPRDVRFATSRLSRHVKMKVILWWPAAVPIGLGISTSSA